MRLHRCACSLDHEAGGKPPEGSEGQPPLDHPSCGPSHHDKWSQPFWDHIQHGSEGKKVRKRKIKHHQDPLVHSHPSKKNNLWTQYLHQRQLLLQTKSSHSLESGGERKTPSGKLGSWEAGSGCPVENDADRAVGDVQFGSFIDKASVDSEVLGM